MGERSVPSEEFRQTYPRLTEAVTVTALGRPIGRWVPINAAIDARAVDAIRPGEPRSTNVGAVLARANQAGRSKR